MKKTTDINGFAVATAGLKQGLVRVEGKRLGRIREVGVGNFRAIDNGANHIGNYPTKTAAAAAIIASEMQA